MCLPSHRLTESFPNATRKSSVKRSRSLHHPPVVVQHNYHDRSEENAPDSSGEAKSSKSSTHREWMNPRDSATAPFPLKLHDLLESVESAGLSDVISWQPHGRCFIIHKPHDFVTKLLPQYMKLSKLASFQRQLNLYGFGRITQGLDKGGYYHEYFLRGKGSLALQIHRIKVKGTGVRGKANPSQEPSLWSLPWVGCGQISQGKCVDSTKREIKLEQDETKSPTIGSQASVVSRDDEEDYFNYNDRTVRKEENDDLPTNFSADVVLMEWGMPFHALDSLPASMISSSSMAKTIPGDNRHVFHDLEDEIYMDQIMNAMIFDQQQEKTSNSLDCDDDDNDRSLVHALEKIVSSRD